MQLYIIYLTLFIFCYCDQGSTSHAVTKNYSLFDSHRRQINDCCPNLDIKQRKSEIACDRYKQIIVWKPNQKLHSNRTIYPHVALIGWLIDENTKVQWNCGGNLISEQFVLSSAHCSTKFEKPPHVVRLSEYDVTNDKLSEQYKIFKLIIHPRFKRSPLQHDLVLIELVESVSLRTYLRPICLIQSNDKRPLQLNTLEMKWFREKSSNKILFQQNRGVRIPEQSCRLNFLTNSSMINNSQICYRTANDLIPCADYIDRAVFYRDTINNSFVYEMIGIFSFCGKNKINVFSDITKYLGWIESIVWI